MSKHPIGFRPSYPKLIVTVPTKEQEPKTHAHTADAIASVTLFDSDMMPYEDYKAKENEDANDEC